MKIFDFHNNEFSNLKSSKECVRICRAAFHLSQLTTFHYGDKVRPINGTSSFGRIIIRAVESKGAWFLYHPCIQSNYHTVRYQYSLKGKNYGNIPQTFDLDCKYIMKFESLNGYSNI